MSLRSSFVVPRCLFGLAIASCGRDVPAPPPNTLSPGEQQEGWSLLFDGRTTTGWRGYGRDAFPEQGWGVEDGMLVVHPSEDGEAGPGGDIVTETTFDDFELSLEFRITDGANSGVFYRVVEQDGHELWQVAPEYQILDDTTYIEMGTMEMRTHLTGDNYDLHASPVTAIRPVGEWNTARIVARGPHVEHWLNGVMTVEYELWSPEWQALVAASKFAEYPVYGAARAGRIGLQDHGSRVEYRNIRIRPIGD